jgi:hypothetical protein
MRRAFRWCPTARTASSVRLRPPVVPDADIVAAMAAETGTESLFGTLPRIERATGYAILTKDLEGRVTRWNPGARRILGYEETEILGHLGEIIFTPEDRAARAPEIEMCPVPSSMAVKVSVGTCARTVPVSGARGKGCHSGCLRRAAGLPQDPASPDRVPPREGVPRIAASGTGSLGQEHACCRAVRGSADAALSRDAYWFSTRMLLQRRCRFFGRWEPQGGAVP